MRRNAIEQEFSILRICLRMCFRFDAISDRYEWITQRYLVKCAELDLKANGYFGVDRTIHIYVYKYSYSFCYFSFAGRSNNFGWYAMWFTPHILCRRPPKYFHNSFFIGYAFGLIWKSRNYEFLFDNVQPIGWSSPPRAVELIVWQTNECIAFNPFNPQVELFFY